MSKVFHCTRCRIPIAKLPVTQPVVCPQCGQTYVTNQQSAAAPKPSSPAPQAQPQSRPAAPASTASTYQGPPSYTPPAYNSSAYTPPAYNPAATRAGSRASISPLDLFDFSFNRYLTPWIVKLLWILALIGTIFLIGMICLGTLGLASLPSILSSAPGAAPGVGVERAIVRSSELLGEAMEDGVPRVVQTVAAAGAPAPSSKLAWQFRSPLESQGSAPFKPLWPEQKSGFDPRGKSSSGVNVLGMIFALFWGLVLIVAALLQLLVIRMFLETLTVLFNMANSLKSIDHHLSRRM